MDSLSRRWWRIMPLAFVTYSLGYLDRANYGFAAAGGMARDLGISPRMSALIGALFFLGYFSLQIPGALYAQRRSVKRLIFVCLLLWGACATLSGVITNVAYLLAVRFVLGATEAAVLPAMLIYLGQWFTRGERSRANTFLILGNPVTILWMSIVSGYLVEAVGWRWMFVVEGVPAALWAVVWWLTVAENPAAALWLSPPDRGELHRRLAAEQVGIKRIGTYREAFRQPVVLILCAQYLCWSVGVYGFVIWLPSILATGSRLGIVRVGWLSAAPYLAAIGAMLLASWVSDRTLGRRRIVGVSLGVGALCFGGSCLLGPAHFWASYGLLTLAGAAMYAPYGPFFAIIPDLLPQNVVGGALALINGMGALGSFGGAYIVGYLSSRSGGPQTGYLFMAAALVLAVMLTAAIRPAPHHSSVGAPGGS